jgi:hypothetical protein
MSVYQFLTVGVKVDYDLDPERSVTLFTKKDRKIVGIGPIRGKSFCMVADSPASYHVNRLTMDSEDRAWAANDIVLWHNRLGHLSLRAIKKLQSNAGVTGMAVKPSSGDECICEACMLGKLCKTPHKTKGEKKRKAAVGDLVHSDLVGPFQTSPTRASGICNNMLLYGAPYI